MFCIVVVFTVLVIETKNPKLTNMPKIINNFQSNFGLWILFNFLPISIPFPICSIAFVSAISSLMPSAI